MRATISNPDPPGWAPGASGAGNPGKRMPKSVSRQPTEQSLLPPARKNQDRDPTVRPGGVR